jgi:tetrahydrodipicolinate N-succinyltransferase
LTTHGYQNHAARSEAWRYIRYGNGEEELYDEKNDPHEWTNLAKDPKYDKAKANLARFFPHGIRSVDPSVVRGRADEGPRTGVMPTGRRP